jgi:hypothetical protein
MCGHPILTRLLEREAATGAEQLIFQRPPGAELIQKQLRIAAVNYPLGVSSWWLNPKYSRYQNLQDQRQRLPATFCYTPFLNLALPLEFQELQNWRAPVVVTVKTGATNTQTGWVKLTKNYVQAVARARLETFEPLGETLVLSQTWLDFSQNELVTDRNWWTLLNQFAQDGLMKACIFTQATDLPTPGQADYKLHLANWLFRRLPLQSSPQAKIAPTARVRGRVILADQAEVGEFCQLQGPLYLGSGVKVGAESNLGPMVFLESQAEIPPSSQLQHLIR